MKHFLTLSPRPQQKPRTTKRNDIPQHIERREVPHPLLRVIHEAQGAAEGEEVTAAPATYETGYALGVG